MSACICALASGCMRPPLAPLTSAVCPGDTGPKEPGGDCVPLAVADAVAVLIELDALIAGSSGPPM